MSRAWLILADTPGLDGRSFARLLDNFGSVEGVVGARVSALREAGLSEETAKRLTQPNEQCVATGLDWLGGAADRHVIGWDDLRYPTLLRQIPDPPIALFVRGDPYSLSAPQLAVVGSRNASAAGTDTARAFAMHLARCGLTITSGLALGIDAAAHRGALAAGGRTVAVLGTGPDQVYPSQHTALADEIARAGTICSEFMPGVPVRRQNFPQRNRIISGLSTGTLVVEARAQSGALITARYATEQGREVFAIPGSIHNPLAKGCHRLIREGAKLVESADHILEELAELLTVPPAAQPTGTDAPAAAPGEREHDPDYARLLDALGWDTADADTLVLRSGLTTAEVSSMLLILELEGTVQPLPGGRYQRQR
jgi:DNA processing protein